MDIRIGIINTARELSFESDQTAGEIEETVQTAIESEAKVIRLSDDKGRVYLVPTAGLAYIEVGPEASRRVGFVA